ncbi:MAG: multicopper oxidase family protein [Sporichthyaceae bacterium]
MHSEISRRSFLALGGLGVAAASGARFAPGAPAFEQPAVVRSAGGRLHVELVAAQGTWLGGVWSQAYGYNRSSPGPTIVVSPGDELTIRLVNRMEQSTNLHTHGLRVSPAGRGDNPFVHVHPGESFDYRIRIPDDHPLGTHWYHPHHHGQVANQVAGGLLGALLVVPRSGLDEAVGRVFVLHEVDLTVEGRPRPPDAFDLHAGRRAAQIRVNGQLAPSTTARVGVPQRWRLINGCPTRAVVPRLEGFRVLQAAVDGSALPALRKTVERIPPGGRADLLVEPLSPGRFEFVNVQRRFVAEESGLSSLGIGEPKFVDDLLPLTTVRVRAGSGTSRPRALTRELEPRLDLKAPVARKRRIVFRDTDAGIASFDGKLFDPSRVDQEAKFGDVEEWTLSNESHMLHPFHLHGWPFVVLGPDGSPPPFGVVQDVVDVGVGEEVTLRVFFVGHRGRSVYHCHILDHEDQGMMGVLEVR